MNGYTGRYGAILGCTVAALGMVSQPASAAQTEITGVQLNPTSGGVQLVLNTQGNQRPPVFTVNRGNSSVADVNNTQLRLPDGGEFRETNGLPEGIKSISVRQLDSNTIRIQVDGVNAAPIADIVRSDNRKGVFVMQFEAGTPDTATTSSVPSTARPNVTPPFKGRASAPPVGDLAIAPLNVDPDKIELGSGRIIPKLLLRDAPVREVVTLLGRAAGVNVAFSEDGEGDTGSTISLDIENESVDDVFNYVIRLSGLQANRVGQTVFVGKELPGDAQNRVVRSVRLNQMKATAKVTSKRSLKSSAETGGSVSGSGDNSGSTTASTALDRSSDVSEEVEGKGAKEVLESYGANESGDAVSTLLKGLSVVADSRTNSVTLIGTPRKVEVATSLLTQLDVRQRQVAVNVQFIDVNLLKSKLTNTDIRYKANNGLGLGVTRGNFNVNLGNAADFAGNALSGGILGLTNNFLAALQVSIQNQNAKILTNPTLLIQEGSAAQVNLTEQIFSGTRVTDSSNGTSSGATTATQSVEPIIQNAGVIMNVSVDRIDDNGFVTLNVSPEVSSLSNQTFVDAFGSTANLLQQRRVETGQIRIRDGQTLVMAGIIQDQDRVDVTKVPILGDIPLLGQLFRRTNNSKQRSELVVLITPQIVNDSDESTYGYNYTPGTEAQNLIRR
ncbi:MAG: AMIN domain-containing protein [Thermosynechococcaceae cyanobacterium]